MRDATIAEAATVLGSEVLSNDFIRRWRDVGPDVMEAVGRVGESGRYVLGEEVAAFEAALARRLGRAAAVGCASGLDAIEMGLRALGLGRGTKVLTTPLSAFATTLGIVRAGGVPVFVDVDESGLLDLSLAEAALAADPSIRCLVPVHLYGHALDLARLASLKGRFGLRLLEDCAQSVTARRGGRAVGSAGDLSAVSFYPTKNLGALGDGGAVLTDDERLSDACRALRDYGQTGKYLHSELGLNSRLDELHAAVLRRALLPRLESWTERRRAVARRYFEEIRTPRVRPLPAAQGAESDWHLFPVLVQDGRRGAFVAHLRARGVQDAVHYPKLICDQRALRDVPFEVYGELARARAIAEGEVSLPIHPYLDDKEVERVVVAVNSWS
jgi:dTDP-3-amino-3,4,6-trideoxy-alpha-D-glucose transaminase